MTTNESSTGSVKNSPPVFSCSLVEFTLSKNFIFRSPNSFSPLTTLLSSAFVHTSLVNLAFAWPSPVGTILCLFRDLKSLNNSESLARFEVNFSNKCNILESCALVMVEVECYKGELEFGALNVCVEKKINILPSGFCPLWIVLGVIKHLVGFQCDNEFYCNVLTMYGVKNCVKVQAGLKVVQEERQYTIDNLNVGQGDNKYVEKNLAVLSLWAADVCSIHGLVKITDKFVHIMRDNLHGLEVSGCALVEQSTFWRKSYLIKENRQRLYVISSM